MIKIIQNLDLYNDIEKYDVILVGTGTYCSMSQGFQRSVMLNFPYVQEMNMETKYGDPKKLGTILECKKEGSPTFVLLFIYEGNFRPDLKSVYLSYESLEKCLKIVNILYKGQKIACTFLGASRFDGNGNKDEIFNIIARSTNNLDLSIYDYEQQSREEKLKEVRISEIRLKTVDLDAYYEAVKKRKKEADERFEKNGHARY